MRALVRGLFREVGWGSTAGCPVTLVVAIGAEQVLGGPPSSSSTALLVRDGRSRGTVLHWSPAALEGRVAADAVLTSSYAAEHVLRLRRR